MSFNDIKDYLEQAERNERLVLFLKNSKNKHFVKWIFVVAYYTARNYFCALLIKRGEGTPLAHMDNKSQLGDISMARNKLYIQEQDGKMNSAGEEYAQLYQWSFDVRYSPRDCSLLQEESLKLAFSHLELVKNLVKNQIT